MGKQASGRRPQPTKLKILRGNPGKRPLNKKEPQPEITIPECPAWLDAEAQVKWHELMPELVRTGILTRLDHDILAGYCTAFSDWKKAQILIYEVEAKSKLGPVIKTPSGEIKAIPQVKIARDCLMAMIKLAIEMGMTPSARSSLTVSPKTDDQKAKETKYFGY